MFHRRCQNGPATIERNHGEKSTNPLRTTLSGRRDPADIQAIHSVCPLEEQVEGAEGSMADYTTGERGVNDIAPGIEVHFERQMAFQGRGVDLTQVRDERDASFRAVELVGAVYRAQFRELRLCMQRHRATRQAANFVAEDQTCTRQ
jgi:hypothetical protein